MNCLKHRRVIKNLLLKKYWLLGGFDLNFVHIRILFML